MSYFGSIIVFNHLTFLFMLRVFQLQKYFKTTRINPEKRKHEQYYNFCNSSLNEIL